MKLGSLFDGSGTCPLAATLCGIEPVWASEIEPYPVKVTKKNFPQMKHLGDITQIKGDEIEPVDIIAFGSPCQDLSVAGKRAGIHDGERSSLFFEAIRIIKEMREKRMEGIQLSLFGRTCPELSAAIGGETFSPFSKRSPKSQRGVMFLNLSQNRGSSNGAKTAASWEMVSRLHGVCWMPNTGESPSAARESTLWQILQADAPVKYYLSARACQGILRRAERRGKKLPTMLREALEEAIGMAQM